MSFAQSAFAQFMSSPAGRIFRIVVGVVLIGWGYTFHEQTAGIAAMVVGLVALAAGVFDFCLLTGLLGGPFSGAAVRQTLKKQA